MNDHSEKQTILVVDDTPENIDILSEIECSNYLTLDPDLRKQLEAEMPKNQTVTSHP